VGATLLLIGGWLMKTLMSINEFQEKYGVSRSTVYRLVEQDHIHFKKIGRAVRIPTEVAEKWYLSLPTQTGKIG
jgi:excisionase family DNA binding protein